MIETYPRRKAGDRLRAERATFGAFSALLPILAIFAALTLRLSSVLNIWQDEAYSLHTTSGSVGSTIRQALVFEAQAPLYFVVLRLWRTIDISVLFARSLSIACVLLAIAVVYAIARRWLPAVHPSLPAVALAANPFAIWAAVEIRLYAFALLLSALTLFFFLDGFIAENPRPGARTAYVAVAIAALYTQYYLGAMIAANLVVVLWLCPGPTKSAYLRCLAAIALASLPILTFLPGQLGTVSGYPVSYNPVRAIGIVLETIDFVLPHGWVRDWTHDPRANALYFAIAATALAILATQWRARRRPSVFTITALIVAGCFVLAIVGAHQQVVVPRHTVVLLVPALLAMFSLFRTTTIQSRTGMWACLTVYAVFSLASLAHAYERPIKQGDWRSVAAYVDERTGPRDMIAVFNPEIQLPFSFYSKSRTNVIAIPVSQGFDRPFDLGKLAITGEAQVADRIGSLPRECHLWLVTADQSPKGAAFSGRAFLETFVATHFITERTRHFDGTTVRELVARGPSARRV